jgi:hypothetical protein
MYIRTLPNVLGAVHVLGAEAPLARIPDVGRLAGPVSPSCSKHHAVRRLGSSQPIHLSSASRNTMAPPQRSSGRVLARDIVAYPDTELNQYLEEHRLEGGGATVVHVEDPENLPETFIQRLRREHSLCSGFVSLRSTLTTKQRPSATPEQRSSLPSDRSRPSHRSVALGTR